METIKIVKYRFFIYKKYLIKKYINYTKLILINKLFTH